MVHVYTYIHICYSALVPGIVLLLKNRRAQDSGSSMLVGPKAEVQAIAGMLGASMMGPLAAR